MAAHAILFLSAAGSAATWAIFLAFLAARLAFRIAACLCRAVVLAGTAGSFSLAAILALAGVLIFFGFGSRLSGVGCCFLILVTRSLSARKALASG